MRAKRTSKMIYYGRTSRTITFVIQMQTGREIDGITLLEADFTGLATNEQSTLFLQLKEWAEEKALYSFAHHPELRVVKSL